MNKARSILLAVAAVAIVYLLYVSVASFVSIQAAADMTADARGDAMMTHFVMPLFGVALVAGLGGAGWFVFGSNASIDLVKPPPPPPAPPKRDYPAPVETTATTISLIEPNIDLRIVLTGDAAKDSEGRKKIGAVMEHYGSGKGGAKPEPVAEGGAA